MTTEQEARHKRFDEKFDRINKTVVTIETFEGFGLEEQRPASDEIKSFLDSEVALAVAQREEEILKMITPPENWKECLKIAYGSTESCAMCGFSPEKLLSLITPNK